MAITKETATWLVEEYNPIRGLRIDSKTIPMHVNALNVILDQERTVPKCATCEWRSIAAIANSVYQQHEDEIMKAYNSKPKGRKKKS